jgi:molecular chaperone DnaK (HSP70)
MVAVSKWSVGFASSTGDFIIVIPKDSPLPARRSVTVTTAVDSQADMSLLVYMGENKKAAENYPLSSVRLECEEKTPAGTPHIKLTFYAYEHSIFRVGVCYKPGRGEQEVCIIPASDVTEEEMNSLRDLVNKMAARSTPQEVGDGDLGVIPLVAVV